MLKQKNMLALHNDALLLNYWNKGGFTLCTEGYADIVINEQNQLLSEIIHYICLWF